MTKENDENFDVVSAAMVVIGDEILSGRTRDTNAGHLASIMTAIGIDLKEVRFVSDDQDAIIEAVNQLRERNTYVFTSGGIGPTHDDITADAIAAAFGLPCDYDDQALKILAEHYKTAALSLLNLASAWPVCQKARTILIIRYQKPPASWLAMCMSWQAFHQFSKLCWIMSFTHCAQAANSCRNQCFQI